MVDTKAQSEYEKENDVLYVYRPGIVKFTISISEDIKLDVDKYGKIIAMEVIDASNVLLVERNILGDIKESKLSVVYNPPWVVIKLFLLCKPNIQTSQIVQVPYNRKIALKSTI